MPDAQAKHFRRLRRLRRSARRWSVSAGILTGAAAVLTPYSGLGLPDAFWAAAAGGSIVLAGWRWVDLRTFAALPPPPAPDPVEAAARTRRKVEAFVTALPGGQGALAELKRHRERAKLSGSAVASGWRRLDRAALTLGGLAGRLGGPGENAVLEAAVAERGLRELADRTASVERGMRFATGESHAALGQAHRALVVQFEEGVTAYEGLVGAAAAYVAEDGQTMTDPSVTRLNDAAELLRAVAAGFAELRGTPRPTEA